MRNNDNLLEVGPDVLPTILKFYQKSEKSLRVDVQSVRNWLSTQNHLPQLMDDKGIKNLLILNKMSIERTKQSIDMFYTMKSRYMDSFGSSNPMLPHMKELTEVLHYVVLPKLTKDMYRVMVLKIHDKSRIDVLDPHKLPGMGANINIVRLKEDVMFGDVFIIDMEGYTLGYMMKWTPTVIAKLLAIYEKVFRFPVKGFYFLNAPPFMNNALLTLKSLVKPKIFQRIHVCLDTSILLEHFPKEIIPKDYGGQEKSVEELNDLLQLKFQEFEDYFKRIDEMKVNEELRPQKLENDEFLGFHGNFKKLEVD